MNIRMCVFLKRLMSFKFNGREQIAMADPFLRDDSSLDESQVYYKVRIKKSWFRGKDVFTERLHFYERMLVHQKEVFMPLNAGNMIYTMMHRLEVGVEWEKQSALMASYRNLVYRLSYTVASWKQSDTGYILFEGHSPYSGSLPEYMITDFCLIRGIEENMIKMRRPRKRIIVYFCDFSFNFHSRFAVS